MIWKSRKGQIEDLNRDFDYEFWLERTPLERVAAAWQMVLDYHIGILGEDEDQLRLQRSLVSIQRQES